MKKAGVILILLLSWWAFADRRGQLMQQHPAPSGFSFCSTDLVLWIEATKVTSANNPIQNGDVITGISDSSCSNNAITVFNSPIYRSSGGGSNNLPFMIVTNDATFGSSTYDLFTNKQFTIIMVLEIFRQGGGSGSYFFGNDGALNRAVAAYDLTGSTFNPNVYDLYNGTHLQSASPTPVITNKWCTLTFLFNGASSLLRTNGADCVSGNAGSISGMLNPWRIGGVTFAGSAHMNGAILRCLIWKRPLSAAEYQAVEAQCNTDFGLY